MKRNIGDKMGKTTIKGHTSLVYVVLIAILITIPTNILVINSESPKEWTDIIDLTPNAKEVYSFDTALDSNNNLHIVWWDYDGGGIYYKKIDQNGAPLIDSQFLIGGSFPSIAVDSKDNILVVS